MITIALKYRLLIDTVTNQIMKPCNPHGLGFDLLLQISYQSKSCYFKLNVITHGAGERGGGGGGGGVNPYSSAFHPHHKVAAAGRRNAIID